MWGPLYVEEKLLEFREQELELRGRRVAAAEPVAARWFLADRLGAALVLLGTRLQAWADAGQTGRENVELARAED